MKKVKKPKSAIFTVISISAVILVMIYVNQSKQMEKHKEATIEKLSEAERLLELDIENDYPQAPRDLAKLHGDITRLLYSGVEDDEIKNLALWSRDIFDDELLTSNTEEQYLTDLYADIALWLKLNRRIEYNLVVNEDKEELYEIDGKEYATVYVSFTITGKGKTSELRRYIMRKDKEDKWKILGWEYITGDQD